jgi:hypothetical protein
MKWGKLNSIFNLIPHQKFEISTKVSAKIFFSPVPQFINRFGCDYLVNENMLGHMPDKWIEHSFRAPVNHLLFEIQVCNQFGTARIYKK